MAGSIWCNFFTGNVRTAAVAFDRYGKDIDANVARPKAVKIVRC
jgi:hypothetical protein